MRDIEEDRPSSNMFPFRLNEMVVNAVESKRESLQIDKDTHNNVYPVDRLSTSSQDESPEGGTC